MSSNAESGGILSTNRLNFAQASRLINAILEDEDQDDDEFGFPHVDGYVINQRLGVGASGEVFLATSQGTAERVAVKLLHRAIGHPKSDRRAWRELDVLSELNIPGVPEVKDFGLAGNRMFVVTTHVEGMALDDYCAVRRLTPRQRVELLARLAQTVQLLHEHGVIHRDLKPANVIVRPDGEPVVVDFGIAALLVDDLRDSLTQAGAPIGSVGFMAPEQARGAKKELSTRSDVFGLGAILCYLLTGQTPHNVKGVAFHEAIRRIAQDQPRDPRQLDPTLSKSLAAIIGRATAQATQDRYATAADFAADLNRWLNDEVIPWQRTNWVKRQVMACRRNPRRFLAAAAIWVLIIATFVSSSIAVAQAQVAHDQIKNAKEQKKLREEADELSRQQAEAAAQWKAAAEVRDAWRAQVEANQIALAELTQAQIEAIEDSMEHGEFYDASLSLWTLGQEIEQLHPNDQQLLHMFVEQFTKLIDAARHQRRMQQEP